MANRGYLVATHTGQGDMDRYLDNDLLRREIAVAGTSNIVPVLWCSIFAPGELLTVYWTDADGQVYAKPVLMSTRDEARRRAIERREHVLTVLPTGLHFIYDEWLRLFDALDTIGAPFVRFDTGDLAGLTSADELFASIMSCARGFELGHADEWTGMLDQGVIEPPILSRPADELIRGGVAFLLRGYSVFEALEWTE